MKQLISFCLLALVLSSAVQPVNAGKDQWLKIRSTHFNLVGNASEKEIRNVGSKLEQFREVFTRLFNKRNYDALAPVTVIVFKNDGAFRPYKPLYQGKPANVAGYFQSGEDVNYIMLSAEQRSDQNPFGIIFHELTHIYTVANARPLPPWLSEGLAEYYSTFSLTDGDKKAWLGSAIANHVLLLRERKLMPLPALFAVTHGSADYNERDRQSIFYAQAWALTHYLILGNQQARQKQFIQFVNMLANGQAVEASFKQAFQTDFVTIEKELQKYLQSNSFLAQYFTFDQKVSFDAEMTATPISEAQASYYLGDVLGRIKRPADALTHLQQAITLDPKLAEAHTAMGMLHLRENRYAEAKAALQQAVAANSQDYRAHYYYAYTVSRELFGENQLVTSIPDAPAQLMRQELKQAIKLAPKFPESYRLLGFIELVTNGNLDEAASLLTEARQLLPGKQDFAILLGQIYLRQEKYDLAKQTLAPVAANVADEAIRQQAQTYLDIVQRMEAERARYQALSEAAKNQSASNESSTGNIVEEVPASPPMLLRRKVEGEIVRGLLTRVDCTNSGITLTVKPTEGASVQLFTATPDKLQFLKYTDEVGDSFTCGAINPPKRVGVTYRKATEAKAKYLGEPLLVEFLPAEK